MASENGRDENKLLFCPGYTIVTRVWAEHSWWCPLVLISVRGADCGALCFVPRNSVSLHGALELCVHKSVSSSDPFGWALEAPK